MRIALVLACACLAGCLRDTAFHCTTNSQCGSTGTCQTDVGFCSEPDGMCASGHRFGASAGTYANQCVGDGATADAAVDSSGADAMIDAPLPPGCPSGYNSITGGQGAHKYRLVTGAENWQAQKASCAATSSSAYLAIPDDQNELNAIQTLSAATQTWVGVTDAATENTFLNVKGMPQVFLPWEAGQPDDAGPGEDCVIIQSSKFRDERCSTKYRAVCECEP